MLLKRFLTIPIALYCCALLPLSGTAGEGDAGHGSVEFGLGFYNNVDGSNGEDGNPFVDEELTVIEPVVIFDYSLTDDTSIWGNFSYDYVSSASIDRLSRFREQSGASADNYFGLDLGLRRQLSRTEKWGVFGHFSGEYDYTSFGLGGDYERELPDMGASFKASLNGFYDWIDIIRYDGKDEGSDNRISLTGQFAWYQEISPVLHSEYGAVVSLQNGFLETPYNAVVIEDVSSPNANLVGNAAGREVTEELEDTRIRGALFGRLRRSLSSSSAAELGGRLYADDWGITGITLEPRWYQWLIADRLRMRMRYRFYTQTAADDFEEHYTSEEATRTQDSDLADFSSHTAGLLFTWTTTGQAEWDVGADYILRDDSINQVLGRIAYRRRF